LARSSEIEAQYVGNEVVLGAGLQGQLGNGQIDTALTPCTPRTSALTPRNLCE